MVLCCGVLKFQSGSLSVKAERMGGLGDVIELIIVLIGFIIEYLTSAS